MLQISLYGKLQKDWGTPDPHWPGDHLRGSGPHARLSKGKGGNLVSQFLLILSLDAKWSQK